MLQIGKIWIKRLYRYSYFQIPVKNSKRNCRISTIWECNIFSGSDEVSNSIRRFFFPFCTKYIWISAVMWKTATLRVWSRKNLQGLLQILQFWFLILQFLFEFFLGIWKNEHTIFFILILPIYSKLTLKKNI